MEYWRHGVGRRLGYHKTLPILQDKPLKQLADSFVVVPDNQGCRDYDTDDKVRRRGTVRVYL